MKALVVTSILIVSAALAGCSTGSTKRSAFSLDQPLVSRLSPNEVIELVRPYFEGAGVKVKPDADYVLSFQITSAERQWMVHLGGFVPGHYNWATVNDETKKVSFLGPDGAADSLHYLRK